MGAPELCRSTSSSFNVESPKKSTPLASKGGLEHVPSIDMRGQSIEQQHVSVEICGQKEGENWGEEIVTRTTLREEFQHFQHMFFKEVLEELGHFTLKDPNPDIQGEIHKLGSPTLSSTRIIENASTCTTVSRTLTEHQHNLDNDVAPFGLRHYRTFVTGEELKTLSPGSSPALLDEHDDDNISIIGEPISCCSPYKSTVNAPAHTAHGRCYKMIIRIVQAPMFDYTMGMLIVLNAISIGVQVDITARTLVERNTQVFFISEWIFCILFALELFLRVCVHHHHFFCGRWWLWNLFDTAVVSLQVIEQSMTLVIAGSDGFANLDLSAMRILRILRIIRIVRLVRVMRLISELRTIVISITGCMRSLGWTMLLLLLLIYIIAVYLTQMVTYTRLGQDDTDPHTEALKHYYGSVAVSILSLFASITGGVTWEFALTPLIESISPFLGVLFALYIAFALLAIMNVVTGTFVESALQTAKTDNDSILMHHIREIFDRNEYDVIGWAEFQSMMDTEQMRQVCKSIDVDTSEARALFKLLDIDESGAVDFEEFLDGCLRLRGSAKAIDLMTVMYEGRRQNRYVASQLEKLEMTIAKLVPELVLVNSGEAKTGIGRQLS